MLKQILISLVGISLSLGQSVDDLSEEQMKEYYRKKLSVEQVTKTSTNVGWYYSLFAKSVTSWRAFQGVSAIIEPDVFFDLCGYEREAIQSREMREKADNNITLGWILGIGGSIIMWIPSEKEEDLGYGVTYTEVTYPLLLPGAVVSILGYYLLYKGYLNKVKPAAPYETAVDMADTYNKNLIKKILSQ